MSGPAPDTAPSPATAELPLCRAYPALAARLPRSAIGHWPTPVQRARTFAPRTGLAELWLKREDLSHPLAGGNKVRGLELLLGDSLRRGQRTLLTFGAAGSHHVARTAIHARPLGLSLVALLLHQPAHDYVAHNLAAALGAEARVVVAHPLTLLPRAALAWLNPRHWRHGRPPRVIAPGGTTPLACIGHVNAAFELQQQIAAGELPEPDYLHVPLGSLGTAAGLLLGCRLAGLRTRVVGLVVSYRWYCTAGRCARIARRCLRRLRALAPAVPDLPIAATDLDVVADAIGNGYACPTPESQATAQAFAADEGIALDPTYSAKALAGALAFIRRRDAGRAVHLFWHTYHGPPAAPRGPQPARVGAALQRYFE
ncbi:MAG: pyridoxal-phosphate dependent enzyme [Phycisphaerae bacterium]